MIAVLSPPTVSEIAWKLRQVLAARKISNKALAEKLEQHPTSVSRLKMQDTLPAIGNDAIEQIRVAITELSSKDFGVCTLSELVELKE